MTMLPLAEVRAALDDGHIAVVQLAVPGDIEAVRAATRSACAAICQAAGNVPLHTSRSATPGQGAVALWRGGPVGVDVEQVRPELIDDDLLALALHPGERIASDGADAMAFFALWTRKEALLKLLGTGLAIPAATISAGQAGMAWSVANLPGMGQVSVRNLPTWPDTAVAVAASTPAPLRLWRTEPGNAPALCRIP